MVALRRLLQFINWDYVGATTSAICAVHCMAFPILFLAGSVTGYGLIHNHRIENVIIAISCLVAAISLVPSYLNHHRRLRPLYLACAGFFLIVLSRFGVPFHFETILTTAGAGLVASSHFLNWKLCRLACASED